MTPIVPIPMNPADAVLAVAADLKATHQVVIYDSALPDGEARTVVRMSASDFLGGLSRLFAAGSITNSPQVVAEARTATSTGATTGTITPGTTYVTVTSANADHIIILPPPVVGMQIVINVGATGFELRSSSPTTIAINGGTGAAAESAIAANSTCFLTCVSTTAWKGFFMDADGDVAKIEAAA